MIVLLIGNVFLVVVVSTQVLKKNIFLNIKKDKDRGHKDPQW